MRLPRLNVRFVLRGLLLGLPLAILGPALWIYLHSPWGQPPAPTPPPPTILVQAGEPPAGFTGLRMWARYRGEDPHPVGSGFFLGLAEGDIVGVAAGHSVSVGDPARPLEQIAFSLPGEEAGSFVFDTLRGPPGPGGSAQDLTGDYVFLAVDQPVPETLVQWPDPRGGPQPGERVWLFSGVASRPGRRLAGTVQSASERAFWVLMDERFDPSQMSGSPVVSQHSGRVLGMVLVGSPRRGRLLIGAQPIASLVSRAASATQGLALPDLDERPRR
jgi:hypothetical protein